MKIIRLLPLFLLVNVLIASEFPADPSKMTLSFKQHTVGRNKVVSNLGDFRIPSQFQLDGGANFIPANDKPPLYPGGSTAFLLAGMRGNDKIFSSGSVWSEHSFYWAFEFFPGGDPWDSIWVVHKGEVVDIPYWPNYKGISDEDFICRFNDYKIHVPDQTKPIGVDVIQVTHSRGIPRFDLWTLIEYYIIPTQADIHDMYFGWWCQLGIGVWNETRTNYDDLRYFDEENKVTFHEDLPGHDADGMAGPLAWKIWLPEDVPPEQVHWSFNNRIMISHFDDIWYDLLSSGKIDPPTTDGDRDGDHGFSSTGVGPFDVKMGDTLHIRLAEVVGIGKEGVLDNIRRLEAMMARDFALPTAPPPPPLRIKPGNHRVTLFWDAQSEDVNPETWRDEYREDYDIESQPFEGYRIYKSFSISGPWRLLDQYDIDNNNFEANTGLIHEYTDIGLLNNVEYYYAVTAFSKSDVITGFQSLESAKELSRVSVIPGTQVPESVGDVFVIPNPYRGDLNYSSYKPPWERPDPNRNIQNQPGRDRWTEYDRRIQFVNVPSPSVIKIYTLAGDLVQSLDHNDSEIGIKDWSLTSSVGQTIASGVYLFTVEDKKNGKIQVGKFVIIK